MSGGALRSWWRRSRLGIGAAGALGLGFVVWAIQPVKQVSEDEVLAVLGEMGSVELADAQRVVLGAPSGALRVCLRRGPWRRSAPSGGTRLQLQVSGQPVVIDLYVGIYPEDDDIEAVRIGAPDRRLAETLAATLADRTGLCVEAAGS